MAIRLRSTLKEWFKRGKYPLEEQFADWIDSFLHKTEDKLPLACVEDLPEQLNAKYDHASGVALEQKHQILRTEFDQHAAASALQFERISDDINDLQAEDERLQGEIDALEVEDERQQGEINLLGMVVETETTRATEEERAIRAEFAAADGASLTEAKDYTDARETAIRADVTTAVDGLQDNVASTLTEAKEYADAAVAALAGTAPETLDTLQELAAALGDDPNFSATMMQMIGERVTTAALAEALDGYLPLTGGVVTGKVSLPELWVNGGIVYHKAQNDTLYAKIDSGLAGTGLVIWKGTETEYNAIGSKSDDTLYVVL